MEVEYKAMEYRVVGGKKVYAIRLGKVLKIKNHLTNNT